MTEKPRRHLRWPAEPPRPKHAYRDTFFVYGGLCVLVIVFAWATGGSILRGVLVAAILFVVGTTYSLVRWHDLVRHLRGRTEKQQP